MGNSGIGQKVTSFVKDSVKSTLGRRFPDSIGVRRHQRILDRYEVNDHIVTKDGSIPVFWWTDAPNFGDLISPWLVENMTECQSSSPIGMSRIM